MKISVSLLLVLCIIFLSSCFKELADNLSNIDQLQWNPTLAVPLAHGTYTIAEFADGLSGENFSTTSRDDGLVVFVYSQDQVFSKTAEELVNIDDANYTTKLQPPTGLLPDLPINGTITNAEQHDFSISTLENDKIFNATLKGGSLDIVLDGDFPASGELVFTFNNLTDNGVPLQTTFTWTYTGSGTQHFERSIDLNGLDIDFSNNGTTFNYFYFTSNLTLNYEGNAVTTLQGIDLVMDVRSMQFSKATLNVGRRTVTTETQQFTLNFIDELKGGVYYFDEPSINFKFNNSFGIPVEVVFNNVTAHSASRGDLLLTGDIANTPVAIGYPAIDQMGTSVETDVVIDHQNSNLPQIIAWQPDSISYSFVGTSNPLANDDIHFALDTSRISADIQLELPMIGRFRNLTIVENFDFNGEDLSDLEYALFRLASSNGFPINADLQLYFLSQNGVFIDSLIYDDKRLLEAGITNNIGKVITPNEKTVDVMVAKDRLGPISAAKRLVLRATLNTPDNDTRSVRIYEEDRLTTKLHVQTEFEVIL